MGEAKRRGSSPPTLPEKARRLLRRWWLLYPGWYRTMISFEFKVILVLLGVALASFLIMSVVFRH